MASPPGAASPRGAELRALREQVAALEAELGSCRGQLERARRRLRRSERRYREARDDGEALRRQVEELTKEAQNREKKKGTSNVGVQTDEYAWSETDYYYYENYYNTDTQNCASELPVQHNHEAEGTEQNVAEESQAAGGIPLKMDGTEVTECGKEESFIQNSQEGEDTSVPEGSLAESLRAAAEAAVSQTGFIYDENTGLYYDHSTGFYYNSENQLYYDPATGIYYYCDVESGRYQFHSRVDLQSYQASGTQHTKDKKGKKKRKDPEWSTSSDFKVRQLTETMANLKISSFGLAASGEVSGFVEVAVLQRGREGHWPSIGGHSICLGPLQEKRRQQQEDLMKINSRCLKRLTGIERNRSCKSKPGKHSGFCCRRSKDLDIEEQKSANSLNCSSTMEQVHSTEEEQSPNTRKKTKTDIDIRNSLTAKESISTESINLHSRKSTPDTGTLTDDSKTIDTESEPEEGEIMDSEYEEYSSEEEVTSEETADSEVSENEDEKIWPPCIRVIVIRSPVLQTGSLYIITAVKPATIGREKDVGHTLQIPEVGVSKFHAEVYFDHDLQNYVLVDQGSQNGTVVNGNQILQPKTKCDPYILEHGDEVKIGDTVLSFHIHPGSDTCDGCEPGQVRAHLRLDKKKESSVFPALSKEERELVRRKALKQIWVKYGLQNTEYENNKAVKNPKYKDRAGKRRETVGSEGTFQRDDTPASVHTEISNSNKGHKMLEKMGWKKGEGLGKDGGGIKDPIHLQLHKTHAGLGTSKPASIEDVQIIQSKNKKNWDKARERFAVNFQEAKTQKDTPKVTPWVRGTAE